MPALLERLASIARMGRPRRLHDGVASAASTLRLAVLGTPRSGNTWLRRVLATGYGLAGETGRELAVHDPAEVAWGDGDRYIVQVHVTRDHPGMFETLTAHGVRVVVPRRHPLDVLVSILQYATKVHDTHRWLFGLGGDEASIRELDPCHPSFVEYACGPRAAALLSVSPSWADAPGSISVSYEQMVAAPGSTLAKLAASVGQSPATAWADALAANTMDRLRQTHGPGHIWQGRPGLWRSVLTKDAADRIYDAHRPLFDRLGERPFASPALTPELALANWKSLA